MNGRQQKTQEAPSGSTFGQVMRRLREQRSLSLAQLGETASVSKSHLGNIEHDHRRPSPDIAKAIDEALKANGKLLELAEPTPRRDRAERRERVRPAQLPAVTHGFVGRVTQLREADRAVDDGAGVIMFDGPAGVGKTALAVRWAHDLAASYPDGVLFIDLRGYVADGRPDDPKVVLGRLLASLGVAPSELPGDLDGRAALFRSLLEGTRTLMVLDNAADAEQIKPLLPGSSSCLTLITSRSRLSGLSVHNGAVRVTLDLMSSQESTALLRQVLGARVDAEPDATEMIAQRCGRLPLTLRIAGERAKLLPRTPLAELAEELGVSQQRLDVLAADQSCAVRSVLSWSYTALPVTAARMFRMLGLHPGGAVGIEAAAALAGCTWAESRSLLEALAAIHLVEQTGASMFAIHDLVALYAAELAEAADGRDGCHTAVGRLVDFYLRSGTAATRLLWPTRPREPLPLPDQQVAPMQFSTPAHAVRWFATELHTLALMVHCGCRWNVDIAAYVPIVISEMLFHRRAWSWWVPALRDALTMARRGGHRNAEAWILEILGDAALDDFDADMARSVFEGSLRIRTELSDLNGQAACHIGIGRTHQQRGDFHQAEEHCTTALALCEEVGDQWAFAVATAHLAAARAALGATDDARELLTNARDTFDRTGDLMSLGCACMMLAMFAESNDELDQAQRHLDAALQAYATVGDVWSQAHILGRIGDLHADHADTASAHHFWSAAADRLNGIAEPAAIELRQQLIASLKENH